MIYDVIIVGGGIVGISTAYQILNQKPNLKILILEKESTIAQHQTGNNSGVIHSGIYYKPGSLKAKNCREGYERLIRFCDEENINYELCGKVIVATKNSELPLLENLYERGIQNGLVKIKMLSKEQLIEYEPYVNGEAGIYVPYTGIIDFKQVAERLLTRTLEKGGNIKFREEVIKIENKCNPIKVVTKNSSFQCKYLITCAGLYSDRIAKLTQKNLHIRIIPFRGEYYRIKDEKKYLVKNLIYPVPDPNFPFLGVHFTRMINGDVEAGPNAVLSFKREGYKKTDFNFKDVYEIFSWKGFRIVMKKYWKTGFGEFYRSFSKKAFTKALQKLIPQIEENDLVKGGAGVRAQACDDKGSLIDDFYFVEQKRILHVCNAPSPAATASLAIGNYISQKVIQNFN